MMLNGLVLRGYRSFDVYQMTGVARVNLVVGKNAYETTVWNLFRQHEVDIVEPLPNGLPPVFRVGICIQDKHHGVPSPRGRLVDAGQSTVRRSGRVPDGPRGQRRQATVTACQDRDKRSPLARRGIWESSSAQGCLACLVGVATKARPAVWHGNHRSVHRTRQPSRSQIRRVVPTRIRSTTVGEVPRDHRHVRLCRKVGFTTDVGRAPLVPSGSGGRRQSVSRRRSPSHAVGRGDRPRAGRAPALRRRDRSLRVGHSDFGFLRASLVRPRDDAIRHLGTAWTHGGGRHGGATGLRGVAAGVRRQLARICRGHLPPRRSGSAGRTRLAPDCSRGSLDQRGDTAAACRHASPRRATHDTVRRLAEFTPTPGDVSGSAPAPAEPR